MKLFVLLSIYLYVDGAIVTLLWLNERKYGKYSNHVKLFGVFFWPLLLPIGTVGITISKYVIPSFNYLKDGVYDIRLKIRYILGK